MKWNEAGGHIFLCCFGSLPGIEGRLRRLIEHADDVQSALYDPYTLYVIILNELYSKMDSIVWDLISVFNHQEKGCILSEQVILLTVDSKYSNTRTHNSRK
jgi:hypothetical protein